MTSRNIPNRSVGLQMSSVTIDLEDEPSLEQWYMSQFESLGLELLRHILVAWNQAILSAREIQKPDWLPITIPDSLQRTYGFL